MHDTHRLFDGALHGWAEADAFFHVLGFAADDAHPLDVGAELACHPQDRGRVQAVRVGHVRVAELRHVRLEHAAPCPGPSPRAMASTRTTAS